MKKNWMLGLTLCASLASAASADGGFVADWTSDFGRVSDRLVELASATPEGSFSWRPADGLRSISEVYVHVAVNNFLFARDLGDVALPEDAPEDPESTLVDKGEVIEFLQMSQEHLRRAVRASAVDPDRETDAFGGRSTVRSVFLFVLGHSHEHLGQAIAYARAVEVVPPWSR